MVKSLLLIGLTMGVFWSCTPQRSEANANAQTLGSAAQKGGLNCEYIPDICTEYFAAGGDITSEMFLSTLEKTSNQCQRKIAQIFEDQSVPVGIVDCVHFVKAQGLRIAE